MFIHIFISLIVTMSYFPFLSSMEHSAGKISTKKHSINPNPVKLLSDAGLELIGSVNHGTLQKYLYEKLDKLWLQKEESTTWQDVNRLAFTWKHPIFLYFIFRTYFEFAYAYQYAEIKDLPCNPNVDLTFDHRLKALKSLMLFRIKSKIDSDICCENRLGDNAKLMHEEFGFKFTKPVTIWGSTSRISIFDDWNKKFYAEGKDRALLTFNYVFECVQVELQNSSVLEQVSSRWIHLCSKSRWEYVYLWPDTFYFADDPIGEDSSTAVKKGMDEDALEFGLRQMTDSGSRVIASRLDEIFSKIEILVQDSHMSDLEKWIAFLKI